jgi:hypothetical protein
LVEDEIYFVDNENENLCKMEGEGRNRALCSVSDDWFVDAQYIWTENYSVLTSACNSLLFSKADGIYAYHLSDGNVNRVYANPKINEYFSVFAFTYEDGTLSCEIRNTPDPYAFGNGATTLRASYSPAGKDHVYDSDSDVICNLCGNLKTGVAYLKGDLDGDLTVNSADAIYLLYHTLFGSDRYPVDQPVDYDKNGTVNSADAIYLLYHTLFGAARYPIE